MLATLPSAIVALEAVRLAREVPLPKPEAVSAPEALRTRLWLPCALPSTVTSAMSPAVAVSVAAADKTSAPLYVCVPVLETLPAKVVCPLALSVRLANAWLAPTTPSATLPVPGVSVKPCPPALVASTALREILLLVVFRVSEFARMTGPV